MAAVRAGSLLLLLLGLAALCVAPAAGSDVFASASNIYKLFSLEKTLAANIRSYHEHQQTVLQDLLALAAEMDAASVPTSEVVQTAADSYTILKRTTENVHRLEVLLGPHDTALEVFMNNRAGMTPDATDLAGAAVSMLRLQRTYNLTSRQLFPTSDFSDLFLIGKHAYTQADYSTAVDWLGRALANATPAQETEVLDYLAYSFYKIGFIAEALRLSERLLALQPTNWRLVDNVAFYRDALATQTADAAPIPVPATNFSQDNLLGHTEEEMSRFRALCRGEVLYTPPEPLFCEFRTYNDPRLLFKPARVEHVTLGHENLQLLRDFATPAECEAMQAEGSRKLERSVAFNGDSFTAANFRISTVAWLSHEAPIAIKINSRISQWTGLSLDSAEQLQVSNYGVGGHYEPHYDFHGERRNKDLPDGDRIATFMLYLSDVAGGGGTAFPRLGARSFPSRGDAVFWINLLDVGIGNPDTLHGACPVLAGSKWVANKWIHERGNEAFHEANFDDEYVDDYDQGLDQEQDQQEHHAQGQQEE